MYIQGKTDHFCVFIHKMKLVCKETIILLSCSIDKSVTDVILRHFAPDIGIYNASSKLWHNYIKNVIYLSLPWIISDFYQIDICTALSRESILSKYFVKISHKKEVHKPLSVSQLSDHPFVVMIKYICRSQQYDLSETSLRSENIVRKPSGQLTLQLMSSQYYYLNGHLLQCTDYVWTFYLDSQLQLNLTFHEIYFHSRYSHCIWEYVKIYDAKDNFLQDIILNNLDVHSKSTKDEIREYWTKRQLCVFCGQHSVFSTYPCFQNIGIRVHIDVPIGLKMNMSFAIIDCHIVKNVNPTQLTGFKPELVYIMRSKHIIHSYSIQVRKVDVVMVDLSRNWFDQFILLDGPHYSQHVSKNLGKIEQTTSFQCTILVHTKTGTIVPNDNTLPSNLVLRKIVYTSAPLPTAHTILLHSQIVMPLDLPHPSCGEAPCVVFIQAQRRSQVNVTVTNVHYIGVDSMTCKYGGLTVAEESGNDYKEIATLCQNHDGFLRLNRRFYSNHSSLKLILYSYNHLSQINTSLMISQSKCTTLQIDPCTTGFIPPSGSHLCFSNMSLEYVHDKYSWCESFAFPPYESCHIVQISNHNTNRDTQKLEKFIFFTQNKQWYARRKPSGRDTHLCLFHLVPESALHSSTTFIFELLVSLQEQMHTKHSAYEIQKHKPIQNSAKVHNSDFVEMFGNPHKACVFSAQVSSPMCKNQEGLYLEEFRRTVSMHGSSVSTERVVVVQKPTPLIRMSLVFALGISAYSHSWVDFIFLMRKEASKQSHQSVLSQYNYQFLPLSKQSHDISRWKFNQNDVIRLFWGLKDARKAAAIGNIMLSICAKFTVTDKPAQPGFDLRTLKWKSHMNLTQWKSYVYISLAGTIRHLSLHTKSDMRNNVSDIHIFVALWIPDNFKTDFSFRPGDNKNTTCHSGLDGQTIKLACLNLTHFGQTTSQSFLLYRNIRTDFNSFMLQLLVHKAGRKSQVSMFSWVEASKLCREHYLHLPYFTNKQELIEVLALVKLIEAARDIEGVFIGMNMKYHNQVREIK